MDSKRQSFDSIINRNGGISIYSHFWDFMGEKSFCENIITKERAIEIVNQLQECINNLNNQNENN